MDQVLAKALKRRLELENELAKLDQFIEMYRDLEGTNREAVDTGGNSQSQDRPSEVARVGSESAIPIRPRGRPADFVRIMEGVLKDAGRPLNRAAMVAEIEVRGINIPSQDKPRYVGTILWRARHKFVHIAEYGYWLKYTALPEVGYDPKSYGPWLADATNISIDRKDQPNLPSIQEDD
ncbi:hypothetical protein SAMN05216338_106242 [Bradyrhizobium sp. Rc2d]|nr:hypothetical protein SAMN05216338_106242 [Bradyrhizobium sp. Rc2d]